MKRFDAQKRVERKQQKALLNVPDEDGFIKGLEGEREGFGGRREGREKEGRK